MGSISNIANYGIAQGHVSNIKRFENKDGSVKYMVTVAAKNAYRNKDNTIGSQYVRMQDFIPKNAVSEGVYAFLEVGDYVEVVYTVINDDYQDKSGKWHYGQILSIQSIDMLESKAAKAARKAAQMNDSYNVNNDMNSNSTDDTIAGSIEENGEGIEGSPFDVEGSPIFN